MQRFTYKLAPSCARLCFNLLGLSQGRAREGADFTGIFAPKFRPRSRKTLFFPVGVAWGEGGRCEREEDIGGTKITQTITQAIAKQLSQVNCAEIVSVNSVEGGSLKTAF